MGEAARSGAGGEGGYLGLSEAHAFSQDDTEAVERRCPSGIRVCNTAQSGLTVGGGAQAARAHRRR